MDSKTQLYPYLICRIGQILPFVPVVALALSACSGGEPSATTEVFQDWVVACQKTDKGDRLCEVHQQVIDGTEHTQLLEVAVGPDPKNTSAMQLRVLVPLGAWLEPGLAVRYDEKAKPFELSYARCVPNGCLADAPFPEELLNAFKEGGQPVVLVGNRDKKVVGVPFSLKGFEAAYTRLKAVDMGLPSWLSWAAQYF